MVNWNLIKQSLFGVSLCLSVLSFNSIHAQETLVQEDATVATTQPATEEKLTLNQQLESIEKLYVNGYISDDQYNESRVLLTRSPQRFSVAQLHRKIVYQDLADGILHPKYLHAALEQANREKEAPKIERFKQENAEDDVQVTMEASERGRYIIINRFPESQREFMKMYREIGKTPEGAAASMVIALNMWVLMKDKREMIRNCVAEIVGGTYSHRGGLGMSVRYGLENQLSAPQRRYIPWSYIEGTTKKGHYALPNAPYKIEFYENRNSRNNPNFVKVFTPSSGADRDRPVAVEKGEDGFYKVIESSTLWVDIDTRHIPNSERFARD